MANRTKIDETTINVGDVIGVHQKIKEGDKERTQVFKGVVIAIKGKGTGKSFTVRRIAAANIGVERIWPVICPSIVKVQVIRKGKVRRSKLYYLRNKLGKAATRIKTKREVKKEKEPKEKKPTKKKTSPKKTKTKKLNKK